jgi:hypothetical protein
MLRLFARRAFAMLFLLVIVSCAGGGGCAGCGAEPIAGGFPRDGVIASSFIFASPMPTSTTHVGGLPAWFAPSGQMCALKVTEKIPEPKVAL